MKIKVDYDGRYPCLCMGNLKVTIEGKVYTFDKYCLISNGSVWFDDDWSEHVEEGPWDIRDDEWPENLPKKYRKAVLEAINEQVEHGCCGGCV